MPKAPFEKRKSKRILNTLFEEKKPPAVQRFVIVGKMDLGTVKFFMLFKGSLLPPLTDLLSRIEGAVP
jgi:hypothetical protein